MPIQLKLFIVLQLSAVGPPSVTEQIAECMHPLIRGVNNQSFNYETLLCNKAKFYIYVFNPKNVSLGSEYHLQFSLHCFD